MCVYVCMYNYICMFAGVCVCYVFKDWLFSGNNIIYLLEPASCFCWWTEVTESHHKLRSIILSQLEKKDDIKTATQTISSEKLSIERKLLTTSNSNFCVFIAFPFSLL